MRHSIFLFILILFAACASLLVPSGCANIVPPAGGPQDTLPPELVAATPGDSTRNFKNDRVTLRFNEYIDLENFMQNVLVSPLSRITAEARLRTITIRFEDSLLSNTTYNINFGNAIKDINEGNILRDYQYTFSTGPALDSLTLSGQIRLAETGGIDSTLVAVLYRNMDDSAVINQDPLYMARLSRTGQFTFRNLPVGTFALYAFDGKSPKRYLNKTNLFAFSDSVIHTGNNVQGIILHAYRELLPILPGTAGGGGPAISPTGVGRPGGASERRLRYTTSIANNVIGLTDTLFLNFTVPLRNFDTTGIRLTRDSTFVPVPHRVIADTSGKRITIGTAWLEGTRYNLFIDQNFSEDTTGRKLLKSDTLTFTTKKRTDYGRINLRFRNVNPALNPVLQFVQSDKVVFSAPLSSGVVRESLFIPGDYDLRVLYDANGNGKWDPGQFFGTRRQPELVRPINRRLTVKPAWDNDLELSL